MQDGLTGRIFDIKPFAVHDGPGIRTTVFFKGCSLRCLWCHNPEAISAKREIAFFPQRCIACGLCVAACPKGAQALRDGGERIYDRTSCATCGNCVKACAAEALVMHGRDLSVDEVMAEIRKDAPFYRSSNGGVTVSGGEPLLQAAFVAELLRACKADGYSTALDTCGQASWAAFNAVLPFTDLVLYDVKHLARERHRALTGAANDLIMDNLLRLNGRGVSIEVRVPIVPGLNDDRKTLEGIAEFLSGLDHVEGVRLLPVHSLAGGKYRSIGKEMPLPDVASPDRDDLERIAGWMVPFGLSVLVPGDRKGQGGFVEGDWPQELRSSDGNREPREEAAS